MREVRKRKGWSAQQLAAQLAGVGLAWDRSIVANLENGRRSSVSVEELLALAYVLDVAPVHLLVPLEEVHYAVTPQWQTSSGRVRRWVRGEHPLPRTDPRVFFSEVPQQEWQTPTMTPEEAEERGRAVEHLRRLAPGANQEGEARGER